MYQKLLITGLLLAFSLSAFFGIVVSMGHEEHGVVNQCPFMSEHVAFCPMSLLEHVSAWQLWFVAIIPLLLLCAVLLYSQRLVGDNRVFSGSAFRPPRRFSLYVLMLIQIFADGILHTRRFA